MFITRGTAPLELNWEAYSSREDFHREKHYDFCSKQVPNSEQNSSNMFQFAAYLEFCVAISLRSSEVFELLQVLSVYTTFPRFLFPREDHRGKEQHLKSLCTDNHKSSYFVQHIHIYHITQITNTSFISYMIISQMIDASNINITSNVTQICAVNI